MKKLWILPVVLMATAFLAPAQTVFWRDEIQGSNINSATPFGASGPVNTAGRFVATGLTAGGISKGGGLASSTVNDAFRATSWGKYVVDPGGSGSAGFFLAEDDYFEFAITPATGGYITFGMFTFTGAVGDNGPTNFSLRASTDNFTNYTEIASFTGPNAGVFTSPISLNSALPTPVTSPIKFRLYAWGRGEAGYFEMQRFEFSGIVSLPVSFGALEAVQQDDAVHIKWTSLKETNNSHFEIEASKDGEVFTAIKTIQSKNGNSDAPQDYEVSIAASDVTSLLSLPAILGLLSLGFNRRKRLAIGAMALVVLGVSFAGCSKQGDMTDVNTIDKVFIRIKQVDKDGAFKYSDAIQVIRK